MNRWMCLLAAGGVVLCLASSLARAESDGLIPRELLFGNPDRMAVRLSHDGKHLSWLAPVNGVLNVWVAPTDDLTKARPVTTDTKRGIFGFEWAYTNQHVLYRQDDGGNENWNIHVVDLVSGVDTNLTPDKSVNARIRHLSPRFPGEILVLLNDRVPQFHDLYRIDIRTAARTLVLQNPCTIDGNTVTGVVSDDELAARLVMTVARDGSQEVFRPAEPARNPGQVGRWKSLTRIPVEDTFTTSPETFDHSGQVLYMTDSRGRDTGALMLLDLKTGEQTLLAEDPRADVGELLLNPQTRRVQAVAFEHLQKQWKVIDPEIEPDLAYLKTVADGQLSVLSRTLDDRLWTVAFTTDVGPVRYYLYHRAARHAGFLFTNRQQLQNVRLARMQPMVLKSRDGLELVCYLTLPPDVDPDGDGKPRQPLAMVVHPHGGPWARDSWGFNPVHQWLANRGYAVLSVNFRGSTGFGKAFVNAGNREWGGKMHDDLIDAVDAMIDAGIADPAKVGIMGVSYGGYAALVGLAFTPQTFACGVDIVGPSNIVTLMQTIPPYWAPAMNLWRARVGDHTTPEGRLFLESRSPLSKVDQICRPLLIGQGANDPRVRKSESDQIVSAMRSRNIPVTYVLYGDEGHGFARAPNRLSFFAVAEAFLAQHLGGRYEPIGDALKGSAIKVPTGADHVPGLSEALEQDR